MTSHYQKCLTYREAELILLTHANAKIVAWPYNQLTNECIVLVQEGE